MLLPDPLKQNGMKKITFVMASLVGLIAFTTKHLKSTASADVSDIKTKADTSCSCKSSFNKIIYGPTVPGDASSTSGQSDFDCFAWSEFIALNWSTDSSASFGDPMNLKPVQWETYIQKEALFLPQGTAP